MVIWLFPHFYIVKLHITVKNNWDEVKYLVVKECQKNKSYKTVRHSLYKGIIVFPFSSFFCYSNNNLFIIMLNSNTRVKCCVKIFVTLII